MITIDGFILSRKVNGKVYYYKTTTDRSHLWTPVQLYAKRFADKDPKYGYGDAAGTAEEAQSIIDFYANTNVQIDRFSVPIGVHY